MGFLDKLTAAAKDAKQTLEKTGLLDSLKDSARDTAQDAKEDLTGIRSDDGQYGEPVDWSPPAAAARYNVANPYELVTTDELSHLTGIELTGPEDGGAENMIGGTWKGRHGKDEYRFGLFTMCMDQEEGRQRTPRDAWETMSELRGYGGDGDVELEGVADEAFITSDTYLYVRKGNTVLLVEASTPDRYDAQAAMRNIAIAATNRLPAMAFTPPDLDADGNEIDPAVAALIDPTTLVSDADMRALTGLDLRPATSSMDDSGRSASWTTVDGSRSYGLTVYKWDAAGGLPTAEGAAAVFETMRRSSGDLATPVAGIGDEAVSLPSSQMLAVRKGANIVLVMLTEGEGDVMNVLTTIAGTAVARLP